MLALTLGTGGQFGLRRGAGASSRITCTVASVLVRAISGRVGLCNCSCLIASLHVAVARDDGLTGSLSRRHLDLNLLHVHGAAVDRA